MGLTPRKTAAGAGRFTRHRASGPQEPDEAAKLELLSIWIGLSKVHEALREQHRSRARKAMRQRVARRRAGRRGRHVTPQRAISFSA